jgi:hypothetical protein
MITSAVRPRAGIRLSHHSMSCSSFCDCRSNARNCFRSGIACLVMLPSVASQYAGVITSAFHALPAHLARSDLGRPSRFVGNLRQLHAAASCNRSMRAIGGRASAQGAPRKPFPEVAQSSTRKASGDLQRTPSGRRIRRDDVRRKSWKRRPQFATLML